MLSIEEEERVTVSFGGGGVSAAVDDPGHFRTLGNTAFGLVNARQHLARLIPVSRTANTHTQPHTYPLEGEETGGLENTAASR